MMRAAAMMTPARTANTSSWKAKLIGAGNGWPKPAAHAVLNVFTGLVNCRCQPSRSARGQASQLPVRSRRYQAKAASGSRARMKVARARSRLPLARRRISAATAARRNNPFTRITQAAPASSTASVHRPLRTASQLPRETARKRDSVDPAARQMAAAGRVGQPGDPAEQNHRHSAGDERDHQPRYRPLPDHQVGGVEHEREAGEEGDLVRQGAAGRPEVAELGDL